MDAAPDDPRIGQTLDGRYQIIAPISSGSMGVIYRAERLKLGRAVAVKFLRGSFATDPQFVGRFEREARAMSRLAHPNCVSIIDVGMADAPYVVMDYVTGQTLRQLIDQGPVDILRATQITRQILAGLAHAHGLGIVHRDIKPANVMLTEATGTGDHVRLLDFGLATLLGVGTGDLSQSNVVVGTPSYMAPEQSRGDKVDGKADVYATAVVFFELITGKKPFNADSSFELIRQHRDSPPPRLAAAAAAEGLTLPPRLDELVYRCMSKDPVERPTAIEMARALEQTIRETGSMAAMPGPAPVATGPRPATSPTPGTLARRGLRAAVALAIVGGVGLLAWRALGPDGDDGEPTARARTRRSARTARGADDGRAPTAATPSRPRPASAIALGSGELPDAGEPADAGAPASDAGGEEVEAFTLDAILDGGTVPELDGGAEPALPADEQEEPVAALPESAVEADRTEPTTVAELDARAAPVAARADTIDEARALIKAGREEEAIAALRRVRAASKKSAYAPYLLGNLYFEKRWWTVGMEHYAEAIAKNRVYRKKAVLNRNVIRALGDRRTARTASALIGRAIGRAALPFLDAAAKHDASRAVRQRASELARQLRGRRLAPGR